MSKRTIYYKVQLFLFSCSIVAKCIVIVRMKFVTQSQKLVIFFCIKCA